MDQKRVYFGYTTSQQRRLLFETWEATGNVTQACRTAHVGRATFYYWKPRFDREGYAGLESFESRVAHKLNSTSEAIAEQVVKMRREHPDWGKARIAHELAKANNWVAVISKNTVKRILKDADLWPENGAGGKISP